MRDISPNEREVLERAARHINVYERVAISTPKADPTAGCFDCDHNVGAMSSGSSYRTIGVKAYYGPQTNLKEDDVVFVVSLGDRFWDRPEIVNDLFRNLMHTKGYGASTTMRDYRMYHYAFDDLPDQSYYVRQVWTPREGLRHINSRINVKTLLRPERWVNGPIPDHHVEIRIMISPSARYSGYYFAPESKPFDKEHGIMNWDSLRLAPDQSTLLRTLRKYFGAANGPELVPIKPKGGSKSKKWQSRSTYDDLTNVTIAEINPFEEANP